MKFLINALLFSGALADVIRRQSSVEQVGADISGLVSKVDAVDTAVEAFNGDAQQAVAIQSAAKDLSTAVDKGIADAKGLPELKQEDALGIAQPVQDLEKSINKTITNLISKKDMFVKAGLGGAVHEILLQQQKGAADFTTALLGKLPVELQPIGQQLAAPISASVTMGVTAFAGLAGSVASAEAGLSGSGSSSGSMPAAPPTDTAPTTSSDTTSMSGSGTAGGYGPPPPPMNTTTPPSYGGNMTNTTTPITPYTGAASSSASAFGISAIVAMVALAAL